MSQTAYQAVVATFTRIYRYEHLGSLAGWDQAAMMPSKGNDARGAAMAELGVLIHNTLTDPALAELIKGAEAEDLSAAEQASLREIKRQWEHANLLPASLVEAKTLVGSHCSHEWRTQRQNNDWQGFLANFREVVRLSREEAQLLAKETGLSPYESLLNKYEPGMSCAELDRIFGDVKSWLPGLIRQAMEKQATEQVIAATGPFAVEKQRALGLDVMALLGFDFEGGRLDVSNHPFCGGVPEDVRITTRYREDDFMQSMMGIVHETGHARYEQSLPRETVALPVGRARSMGIHESQSLSFEMQLGRNPAFLALISPLVKKHLGDQPAFEAANLAKMYTRVHPDFIRVDADELTYPAHVILRYEIERALIDGEIEADDVPALWDEKMQAYLGVDTKGNFKNGCLQDIHWTDGAFGYFPSYTLGAMYAAQYFATIRKQQPDLDERIAAGDLAPIFNWLNANIWSQASQWETGELVRRATGEPLNPAHFRKHLEQRYLA
ncbi:carboxypeptidase M32 [Iodobacter fluviatilis]|uniref:Metal-dependent carboxypeptidase n=1 Tax=Iodobacter fluviatilis TaxID=537 RepID=A0A377SV54_9NEIS|nr:carboxypeptidase M32 [Iodobacter fluviatilis]TCU82043.1 carboxypeptidase Taq [Iodobacter fluviatilis]STR44863.1 Thermostable carboxypeptidase 1 [Iodobacter fluviatilis]